jgi:WD40 repeat protein
MEYPSMALFSTTPKTVKTSHVLENCAFFNALVALAAGILAFTDRWCPIPVASEELAIVGVLLLLPLLACNFHHARPSSPVDCQKKVSADVTDIDAHSDEDVQKEELHAATSKQADCDTVVTRHQYLATASFDGTVMLWEASGGVCQHTFEGHTGGLSAVTFSTDGKTMATGGCDGTARIWDIETGVCKHILDDGGGGVSSISISPCGGLIVTGLDDHCAALWRIDSEDTPNAPELFFEGHEGNISSVDFSPSGDLVATGSWDGTARIWNVISGDCVQILGAHTAEVFSVAFSPHGDMLATTSQDGTARLWNVSSGWNFRTFDDYDTAVRCSSFSPCGDLFATGCWDGGVKLLDVDTGACHMSIDGHRQDGPIRGIAFSVDGTIAVASGKAARLWSIRNGDCIQAFEGHKDIVQSVAISHR